MIYLEFLFMLFFENVDLVFCLSVIYLGMNCFYKVYSCFWRRDVYFIKLVIEKIVCIIYFDLYRIIDFDIE